MLFPQDPVRLPNPGAPTPKDSSWGDYHPCTAEFFLARSFLRAEPRPYYQGLASPRWKGLPRTGIEEMKRIVARQASPAQTRDWELDLAEVPSQDDRGAWQAYAGLLEERTDHPYSRKVVYARYVPDGDAAALQYWYLYAYNDFWAWNNHEADWEMCVIELAPDGSPRQMGVSNHLGGSRLPWERVRKEGDRPLLYVAKGSHAGFFRYNKRGYHVLHITPRLNPPLGLGWALSVLARLVYALRRLPGLRRWRDLPPAHPTRDLDRLPQHLGQEVDPELKVLPESTEGLLDAEWWRRYEGKWGSCHSRIRGGVGVDSPWYQREQPARWEDPLAWVRSLPAAEPPLSDR